MQSLVCLPVSTDLNATVPNPVVSDDEKAAPRASSPASASSSSSRGKLLPAAALRNFPCGRGKTIRVPCKARGVPDVHNARTAYIDIPPNAMHGMILICSHPTCSKSGRRFRYCAVCELPVAKRNFMKRHSHGLLQAPRLPFTKEEDIDVPEDDASASSTHSIKRQRLNSSGLALHIPEATDEASFSQKPHSSTVGVPRTVVIQDSAQSAAESLNDTETETTVSAGTRPPSSSPMSLTPAETKWLALLHNRPKTKNAEGMKKWMEAILEAADGHVGCDDDEELNRVYRGLEDHRIAAKGTSDNEEVVEINPDEAAIWDMQDLLMDDFCDW